MKETHKNEKGALAIEAILGITIFLITVISVMFFSLIVRIQANVQYALGQTAKEISGYYYLLDKMGLAEMTALDNKRTDIDKTISDVYDLYGEAEEIGDNIANIASGDFSSDDLAELGTNIANKKDVILKKAQAIGSDLELIGSDPGKQVKAVLSVFAKTMANSAMSYCVAPFVCRTIMPRYMGGDKESADRMLEAAGVKGGINAVDFSYSQLLTDGRSIKLVATYKLDVSKITFGIVKKEIILRQVASTAAWVRPNGNNLKDIKKLSPPPIPKSTPAKKEESEDGKSESMEAKE